MSAAPGPWVRALAPAKVNPFLEVLGRRADGYHELETTLLALELADELALRTTGDGQMRLTLKGPFASADVPVDRRNLAFAAAFAALEHARARGAASGATGLELELTKHVPSRAGLGGASADAAAALVASERALGCPLDARAASELLATLGSDCVFFRAAAASGFARCTGRGEQVEVLPAPAREWSLVVVTPGCVAATADVYRALAVPLRNAEAPRSLTRDALAFPLPQARASLFNRLEEAALAAIPELCPWRSLLDEFGAAHFRLCGSGASFFGLFDERDRAAAMQRALLDACVRRALEPRGIWITRAGRAGARCLD